MGIESVRLGACSITFDGIDLGYTRGGVTISIESKIDEMEILGDANNSGFRLKSQIIRAECPLAETSKTVIAACLPGATIATSSIALMNNESIINLDSYAKALVITTKWGEIITIAKALPLPNLSLLHSPSELRIATITFRALRDTDGTLIRFNW